MIPMPRLVSSGFAVVLSACGLALAAPPAVTLTQVASGLASPLEIAHAGDGSGSLFIVEKGGKIRILKGGAVLATAFLDLSTTGLVSTVGEGGLLGLAFHPQFASNRAFYVYYTSSSGGALVIARYLRSLLDANVADPASGSVLLTIPHPVNTNHNGGHLAFGPDGHLYIGTGDGGGGGDPDRNGQRLTTRLGKILRIAVDGGTGYGIPASNPYAGQSCAGTACPEIFHFGVRNPWKFSFDRGSSDLYIGDVGQDAIEEVDWLPAGTAGGKNLGWGVFEGNNCYNNSYFGVAGACTSLAPSHWPPVISYPHVASTGGFAVTGGYVYRGRKSAAMRGYYVYGDYGSKRIWAARRVGTAWENNVLVAAPAVAGGISSFGEDESGEIYVADIDNGRIWRIDPAGPGITVRNDFDGDGRADIFWRNEGTGGDGSTYFYPMNGTSVLAGEGFSRTVADLGWMIVGTGDFDGDGKADVLWRNSTTGDNYVYLMDGRTIKPGEGSIRRVNDLNWQVAGICDLDGDGKDDIVWRNAATGENYLYPMNGLVIKGTEGYLRQVSDTNWKITGIGDFDGDGKCDLLWRHGVTGQNYVYPMDGTAIKAGEGYIRQVSDVRWKVAGIGDFDGDGKADILWRNTATGDNYIYPMDGLAIKSTEGPIRTVADQDWQVASVGDFDGDGKADILWRNAITGDNYLYPMNGTQVRAIEGFLRTVPQPNWTIKSR